LAVLATVQAVVGFGAGRDLKWVPRKTQAASASASASA